MTTTAVAPVDDIEVDAITELQAVTHIVRSLRSGRGGFVVTPNLDHLKRLADGGALLEAYQRASLVLPDGRPVLWAAKAAGRPLPERVPGASLMWSLTAAVAPIGVPVALVGGAPGAAGEAADRLRRRAPRLEIEVLPAPEIDPRPSPAQVDEVSAALGASAARIVFLAFGCPKQELLAARLAERHPDTWFIGVGGAFEMAAGRVRRAPVLVQRAGMEWAYRLVQEPRRLWRRYLVDDLPFLPGLMLRSRRRRIELGTPAPAPTAAATPTPGQPVVRGRGWRPTSTVRPGPSARPRHEASQPG